MNKYCEQCKDFHEGNELCPQYKEQLKQHPEWFNEMVQTVVTANTASPIVQRYGAAVKEHLVAYSGVDNQTGQTLTRSLKSISQQQTNPNYEYQNLKQKAGFAAENTEVAKTNAKRAINGESGRLSRYDDARNGAVNHELYDVVEVDANGYIIDGTGVQMKFVGADAASCWDKLKSKDFQKYVDSKTPIKVPSDYYEKVLETADEQIKKLSEQYNTLMANGEYERAASVQQRLEHCEETKALVRKSQTSTKEAMYAAKHPEKYTAKEIMKNANQAGLEGAAYGAAIGGGISIIRNVVQLKNGDIEADVAVKNITVDTAKGAAGGYVVSAGGAILKGVMQNSKSAAVNALSETHFPSGAVGLAYGITKAGITNFMKYKNGEMSKEAVTKSFAKDAVKGSLITCSLAMISFPPTAAGTAVTMGVAMYFDAVCTNMLDEVFGEGVYEQILNTCGYVTEAAKNVGEMVTQVQNNVARINRSLRSLHKSNKQTNKNLDEANKLLRGI